jgi:hypothetical protein
MIIFLNVDPAFRRWDHSMASMSRRIQSAKKFRRPGGDGSAAPSTRHPNGSRCLAVSAHGSLAAISDGIEIVRRMATISHFHAPSSPGRR